MRRKAFFSKQEVMFKHTTLCSKCGRHGECLSPKMKASGYNEKKILVVGKAPTKEDDERGHQFVGEYGAVLRESLAKHGVDLERDCRKLHAVNCGFGTPTHEQIQHCLPMLRREIEDNPPDVIIPMGNSALQATLGEIWRKSFGGIDRWHGFQIPVDGRWICPVFDPMAVLERQYDTSYRTTFERDLGGAVGRVGTKSTTFKPKIEVLESDEAEKLLNDLIKRAECESYMMAFDYETSGLKPYNKGHFIYSIGLAVCNEKGYSFLANSKLNSLFCKLLVDRRVRLVAQNLKYEKEWSEAILKVVPLGWAFDTMIASHILDNREGITGLKFQAFVQFGVAPYDEEISSFLKAKSSNGINNILKAPVNKLLEYNAMDAVLTLKLARRQMRQISEF